MKFGSKIGNMDPTCEVRLYGSENREKRREEPRVEEGIEGARGEGPKVRGSVRSAELRSEMVQFASDKFGS